MKGFLIAATFAAPLLAYDTVALAQLDETPVVQSTGPWQLDAGDEKCRLVLVFGKAPDGSILFMEQDQPGSTVGFAIAGPSLEDTDWEEAVALHFGSLPAIAVDRYARGNVAEYKPALLINSASLAEPLPEDTNGTDAEVEMPQGLRLIPSERFEDVDELRIMQAGEAKLALALPNLKGALDALNVCAQDFITFWGLDLEQHRVMRKRPKWTNSKRIIRQIVDNYPVDALRSGEQGTVRFVVIVDEKGKVIECRQSDVTKLETLDPRVCNLLRRAEFEPALDAEGNPMKSYYASAIRYLLP